MNGVWSSVIIGAKAADVYVPAGTAQPRFAVLHLHGLDQETLRERPAFTRLFDELNMPCVCPHGQRSWWGSRICAEFERTLSPERHLLDEVLPYFRSRWNLTPRAIGLQGICMGGQGALRLAYKYADLFPVVAAIAPALDYHELHGSGTPLDDMYDSKEQCRQDTALMHVPPHHYPPHIFYCIDPGNARWYRGNDRMHEKLNALGVPHEYECLAKGDGPGWGYYNHMAERSVRFIHAGLEIESRRLL